MAPTSRPADRLHLTLERISSLFRTELRAAAGEHDLKLVQLEALIFLSVANRYSDTAGAMAEYLGVTKGTVSQTLLALERRGLIAKTPDPDDGRVLHCRLTADGASIAKSTHPIHALADTSEADGAAAQSAATELLRQLQRGRGLRTFGQCDSCALFEERGSRYRCGLTGERLSRDDSTRVCREHQPATDRRADI
jgi:DNA-binding MarR family transcriptional regulator